MALKQLLRSIQWLWILVVSLIILLLISASVFLSIAIYAASEAMLGSIPGQAEIAAFSELFGRIIGSLSSIALTLFATTWLALRLRRYPRLHGLIIGGIVAASTLISDLIFSPPTAPDEWAAILLTILAGWLGGGWGGFILTNRESVYRSSQAIKGANRTDAIKAIGEHLANPSIVLITLVNLSGALDLGLAWKSSLNITVPTSIGWLPTPLEPFTVSKVTNLPWRSHLLIALTSDECLLVASRNKNGFSRTDIQNYLTIGEQISLSFENLRLIDQARETGIMQERQRLAGEIHDVLTQGFISIVTHLEMAESKLEKSPDEVQLLLDKTRQIARDNLGAARQMTWALRPDLLTGEPLSSSIKSLAQRWSNENGIPVLFTATGNELKLHPDIETAILRAAREVLNNIGKHANADKVSLTLTYLDTIVALDVQDNGKGFQLESSPAHGSSGGFGLPSMRKQVEYLGGELNIESEPNIGTTIAVSIPIN
ncbi:MAG: sensor histidine kinase [Chloroflexota bacterium]